VWRWTIAESGFTAWVHQSFVWRNDGCRSFDDYLSRFKTNQRRNIRRERKRIADQGIEMRPFAGECIPGEFFTHMHRLYRRTNDKFGPWGCRYLTRDFFDGLPDSFRHRLVFMAAYDKTNDRLPLGMSLLVTKKDRLFGRYWGSCDEIDNLHFNACYYAPIQWAIENGIRRFDPGLGGPHKTRRGFIALANHSLHYFYDPRLRRIMETHMDEINRAESAQIERLNRGLPFRSSDAL
jgi:predicted N-acyltransferase